MGKQLCLWRATFMNSMGHKNEKNQKPTKYIYFKNQ